jgi:hypothetical protein
MGCHKNITINTFPRQGLMFGKRTEVCFYYDTSKTILGTIVRDDVEEPFEGIIKLDDGRYIRTTECQYSPFMKEVIVNVSKP